MDIQTGILTLYEQTPYLGAFIFVAHIIICFTIGYRNQRIKPKQSHARNINKKNPPVKRTLTTYKRKHGKK